MHSAHTHIHVLMSILLVYLNYLDALLSPLNNLKPPFYMPDNVAHAKPRAPYQIQYSKTNMA